MPLTSGDRLGQYEIATLFEGVAGRVLAVIRDGLIRLTAETAERGSPVLSNSVIEIRRFA